MAQKRLRLPVKLSKTYNPAEIYDVIVGVINDIEDAKFDGTSGHPHDGLPGNGPTIPLGGAVVGWREDTVAVVSSAYFNNEVDALAIADVGGVATLGLVSGYVIPTTTQETNWNTAYSNTHVAATAGTGISITGQQVSCTITQYTDTMARASISEMATGLSYDNSTGVFTITAGYVIPTTTKETAWDTCASRVDQDLRVSASPQFAAVAAGTFTGALSGNATTSSSCSGNAASATKWGSVSYPSLVAGDIVIYGTSSWTGVQPSAITVGAATFAATAESAASATMAGYCTAWPGASGATSIGGGLENASGVLGIAAGGVTLARMANIAQNTLIGNNTTVGAPIALTIAQVKTMCGYYTQDDNIQVGTVKIAQVGGTAGKFQTIDGGATTQDWTVKLPATYVNGQILSCAVSGSTVTLSTVSALTSALTSAHIFVGNAGGVATDVAMSGDISINNAGATAIASEVIVNADINTSAAIAVSKLAGGNDGSASGYFKLGNMMMQWGTASISFTNENSKTNAYTFPVAFKAGSTPFVIPSYDSKDSIGNLTCFIGNAVSNSGFTVRLTNATLANVTGTITGYYIAIGLIA